MWLLYDYVLGEPAVRNRYRLSGPLPTLMGAANRRRFHLQRHYRHSTPNPEIVADAPPAQVFLRPACVGRGEQLAGGDDSGSYGAVRPATRESVGGAVETFKVALSV